MVSGESWWKDDSEQGSPSELEEKEGSVTWANVSDGNKGRWECGTHVDSAFGFRSRMRDLRAMGTFPNMISIRSRSNKVTFRR